MDQNWKTHTTSNKITKLQPKTRKELNRITTVTLILWNVALTKVIQHIFYQKKKKKNISLWRRSPLITGSIR